MGGCTHPQTGQPITELGDDEMEIGMGQHGEGGGGRGKILSADETANIMFSNLAKAVDLKAGETVYIIINGARRDDAHGACDSPSAAAKKCAEAAGAKVVAA